MELMALIHFSFFLLYVYLILFIVLRNPTSKVNIMYGLFIACGAIWSLCYAFFQNPETTREQARLIINIASLGWINFGVIFFGFVLAFVNKKRGSFAFKLLYIFLLFSLFLNARQWIHPMTGDVVRASFGWVYTWSDTAGFVTFQIYYVIAVIVSVFYLIKFALDTSAKKERKKVFPILFSLVAPMIAGSITDMLLPRMRLYIFPPLSDIWALIWFLGMFYAMLKYRYIEFTPESAAGNILETMADSLVLVSPDGNILDLNKYTVDMLGYDKKDIIGRPFQYLFAGEKGKTMLEAKKLLTLLDGGPIRGYNVIYLTAHGEEIPVNLSASQIRDRDGNIAGIVSIARDMREVLRLIDKEKELSAEMAARETEKRKSKELEKAYNNLKDAQDMLVRSEKLRELGELGASVAHELNNPLAGVLCLIRLYKKKQPPGSSEHEDLEEMEKGLEFMAGIVRGLSDFTKGALDKFVEIDLNEVTESTLGLVAAQLERRKITLITDICPGRVMIMGDKVQIQQVILNFINNAKDAIRKEGIIKVVTKTGKNGKDPYAVLSVGDTGSGIREDIRNKIFDPFFTTKRPGGGVGLGLTVAHSIIKAHKGDISVSGEEGKGTVFTIRLPLADTVNRP